MSLSVYANFNLTLSVDGSTVVHCNRLSTGAVLVGHFKVTSTYLTGIRDAMNGHTIWFNGVVEPPGL